MVTRRALYSAGSVTVAESRVTAVRERMRPLMEDIVLRK
jgi:hypothetical protein